MKIVIDDSDIELLPITVEQKKTPLPALPLPSVDSDGELVITGTIVDEKKLGRSGTLTQLERELIASDAVSLSVVGVSQAEVARLHGTSQQSVSSLSRGFNTTGIDNRKVNEGVAEVVESARERIANTATQKLLESLEHFVPQTLDQEKLPSAALKLATVVEKVTQGFSGLSSNGPQFIVFSPRVRAEDSYDVIQVVE